MLDHLQEKHFNRLARLVEDHTGIRLPPAKRTMVEGRLRKRMRALGLSRLDEYGAAIFEEGKLVDEFPHLVDCVTTNKTDFFREPDHFDFFRTVALPALLETRRAPDTSLKFWSAAASIGAEAYTIAMVAAEVLGLEGRPFIVLGTDISTDVIRQAQRAIYPATMVEPVPPALRHRYVMRSINTDRREIRIVPELRRLTRFQHLNLMDETYPVDKGIDIIFCRNILIYFTRSTQDIVLRRLCSHLRKGGYLILGHSESLAGVEQTTMRQVAPTIFRRVG
jgi:chemotaxis protein methyltransferase CheR